MKIIDINSINIYDTTRLCLSRSVVVANICPCGCAVIKLFLQFAPFTRNFWEEIIGDV